MKEKKSGKPHSSHDTWRRKTWRLFLQPEYQSPDMGNLATWEHMA
jgi:hypothetical protein